MRAHDDHWWAAVLAAGEGVRVREFVREHTGADLPKQYSIFTGTRSLLRHTLDRVERVVAPEHVISLIAADHEDLSRETLTTAERNRVLLIPRNRETGPNVLCATLRIHSLDPEAVILFAPSDHFILEEEHFITYVEAAFRFVAAFPHFAVLLGVRTHEPDPEYGWIELAGDFLAHAGNRFGKVNRFYEKPSRRVAAGLHRRGALVNTMITIASAGVMMSLFHHAEPDVYQHVLRAKLSHGDRLDDETMATLFKAMPSFSFAQTILQQNPDRLRVLRMDGVYWSDWGKKERILRDLSLLGRGG